MLVRITVSCAALLFCAACGGSAGSLEDGSADPGELRLAGKTLSVRGGTHLLGGRQSLAALISIRDDLGKGPTTPWNLTFTAPSGEEVASETYDDNSEGSFMGFWWPNVAAEPGKYTATATVGTDRASISFQVVEPTLGFVANSSFERRTGLLTWDAAEGAKSYSCRLFSATATQSTTSPSTARSCAFGALSDGAWSASMLAFSADLAALSAERDALPTLPVSFEVTEVKYGFAISGDGGYQLRAAGGPLNYGSITQGLAVAVDLTVLGAGASDRPWNLDVSGPAFANGETWRAMLPPGARRAVFWSYDYRPRSGNYGLKAQSDAGTVATDFVIGEEPPLQQPQGVLVQPSPSGAAEVTFEPVASARAYLVAGWAFGAAAPTAEVWVASSPARFPSQTFTAGTSYDVFVSATNVDVLGAASLPSTVKVSENTYAPAVFTAP